MMLSSLLLVFTATAATPPAAAPPAGVTVRWRGDNLESSALPAEMSAAARSAIESWAEWAAENSYRMDLSRDARVLLVSSARNRSRGRQMKLVERTIAFFDATLPPPAGRAATATPLVAGGKGDGADPAPGGKPLPDDPEGESHPWESPGDVGLEGLDDPEEITWAWGAGSIVPDTETIVFFVLHQPAHLESVLAHMAELAPYLAGWIGTAKQYTGFTIEQPLAGCYVEIGEGREEWDPDAELVNRIANLLLLRRFGRQPYWLTQGWAWYAELELRGGIYCFPYRDEFVWATEHSGWRGSLRALFARRAKNPVRLEEAARWQRGTYEDESAKISWGLADYLVKAHGAELPELLEALRLYRDAHDRVRDSETDWHRDPAYLIPIAEQDRLLREHIGEDWRREATRHFRGDK